MASRLIRPAVRIMRDDDLATWKIEAIKHKITLADLFYFKMNQPLLATTVQDIERKKQAIEQVAS